MSNAPSLAHAYERVRLVTEGTIEERVLQLHASKRALSADALGELDVFSKLDVAALVDL